jgi:hypothetical protein
MSKLIVTACTLTLVCLFAKPTNDRFAKYKPVSAYEIRPGILVMPIYAQDGQLCEAVIQNEIYTVGAGVRNSGMPHALVMQIVDELVPDSEKGPMLIDPVFADVWLYAGGSVSWIGGDRQNVFIDIARMQSSQDDYIAVIKWKNRGCPESQHPGKS